MAPTIQTDITVLDSLLALNLDICIWSARRKMTAEDFGGVELPPEDLASLGSKRICDPERMKVFGTLKARAVNFLDRHGVRFMSGWAIPEAKAADIIDELIRIRDEFLAAKESFLADYDQSIEDWIAKHSTWGEIIRKSVVSSDYVRSRLSFRWQIFKVDPVTQHESDTVVLEAGLADEVTNLGNTLFAEIAKDANDIWKRVYCGKTEVTHKALSPLRTLHSKLEGLAFVEPHVAPAADLIKTALDRTPSKKGLITGTDLMLLQGVVSMLRDPAQLVEHSQKVLAGHAPGSVLDTMIGVQNTGVEPVAAPAPVASETAAEPGESEPEIEVVPPVHIPPTPQTQIGLPSFGLW